MCIIDVIINNYTNVMLDTNILIFRHDCVDEARTRRYSTFDATFLSAIRGKFHGKRIIIDNESNNFRIIQRSRSSSHLLTRHASSDDTVLESSRDYSAYNELLVIVAEGKGEEIVNHFMNHRKASLREGIIRWPRLIFIHDKVTTVIT